MENNNKERRLYMQIGAARLLNIKVILDDNPDAIYEGMVEDAPEKIRKLKYSNVDMAGNVMVYYVYSDLN